MILLVLCVSKIRYFDHDDVLFSLNILRKDGDFPLSNKIIQHIQIRVCKTTIWAFEIYELQAICFDHLVGKLKFRSSATLLLVA